MIIVACLLAAVSTLSTNALAQARSTTVAELAETTHFHGIAVDALRSDHLLLATHHGIYTIDSEGAAQRLSRSRDDFMGFAPHPTDTSILIASGHPAGGGNLGFIISQDGGETWIKKADGVGGPVDFHQLVVSPADPDVIYGVFRGLQRSTDGGDTWHRVGDAPDGLIALAASARRASFLYAATQNGILRSGDGGRNWRASHAEGTPTTLIHTTPDGVVYAYVIGVGFIRSMEQDGDWEVLNPGFGSRYLLHLAVDRADPQRLFAIAFDANTKKPAIWRSTDGGISWTPIGGS